MTPAIAASPATISDPDARGAAAAPGHRARHREEGGVQRRAPRALQARSRANRPTGPRAASRAARPHSPASATRAARSGTHSPPLAAAAVEDHQREQRHRRPVPQREPALVPGGDEQQHRQRGGREPVEPGLPEPRSAVSDAPRWVPSRPCAGFPCSRSFPLSSWPSPSAAAAQGVPSDPEADSPSGVVYEIPAERARKDAAPKDGDGSRRATRRSQSGGGSSGGGIRRLGRVGGASETSIRSENNFGTSSNVPGAARRRSGADRDGDGAAATAASQRRRRQLGRRRGR